MTQSTEAALYAQDGVNLSLGDRFSKYARACAEETWQCSPYVCVQDLADGHFRGPRGVSYRNLPDGCVFAMAADGVGTKVGIHSAAHTHVSAGADLIAMCVADITRWGGLPLTFSNLLDVSTLGRDEASPAYQSFKVMMGGLTEAAKLVQVAVITGETAELGPYVGSEDPEAVTKFNWAGFAEGVYHPNAMITGRDIRPGQVVIALREYGFRSNGLSGVRKALAYRFGDAWWSNPEAFKSLETIARPSELYDHLLVEANGWSSQFQNRIPIAGIAHISGGGIPTKFGELLFQSGHSAELYDLFDPPRIMRNVADWRQLRGEHLSDEDFYRTWNGGQGVLVVLDEKHASRFMNLAHSCGVVPKVCGHITESRDRPALIIRSRYRVGETVVITKP